MRGLLEKCSDFAFSRLRLTLTWAALLTVALVIACLQLDSIALQKVTFGYGQDFGHLLPKDSILDFLFDDVDRIGNFDKIDYDHGSHEEVFAQSMAANGYIGNTTYRPRERQMTEIKPHEKITPFLTKQRPNRGEYIGDALKFRVTILLFFVFLGWLLNFYVFYRWIWGSECVRLNVLERYVQFNVGATTKNHANATTFLERLLQIKLSMHGRGNLVNESSSVTGSGNKTRRFLRCFVAAAQLASNIYLLVCFMHYDLQAHKGKYGMPFYLAHRYHAGRFWEWQMWSEFFSMRLPYWWLNKPYTWAPESMPLVRKMAGFLKEGCTSLENCPPYELMKNPEAGRFWREELDCSKRGLMVLGRLAKVFDLWMNHPDVKIKYEMHNGSVLGAVRDPDRFMGMIPHDKDVDVIVAIEDMPRLLNSWRLLPEDLVLKHELTEGQEVNHRNFFGILLPHVKLMDINTCTVPKATHEYYKWSSDFRFFEWERPFYGQSGGLNVDIFFKVAGDHFHENILPEYSKEPGLSKKLSLKYEVVDAALARKIPKKIHDPYWPSPEPLRNYTILGWPVSIHPDFREILTHGLRQPPSKWTHYKPYSLKYMIFFDADVHCGWYGLEGYRQRAEYRWSDDASKEASAQRQFQLEKQFREDCGSAVATFPSFGFLFSKCGQSPLQGGRFFRNNTHYERVLSRENIYTYFDNFFPALTSRFNCDRCLKHHPTLWPLFLADHAYP